MGKVVEVIGDIVNLPITIQKKINVDNYNKVGDILGGDIGDFFHAVANLEDNVVDGVLGAMEDFAVGVVQGDFKKAFRAFGQIVMVALVVVAVVFSCFNPIVIMAAMVVLDSMFNASAFLLYLLDVVGNIEHAIFGTNYIHEYREVIAGALVFISTIYISWIAGGYITKMDFVLQLQESYASLYAAWKMLGSVMELYNIYDGLKAIVESASYWNHALQEYLAELQSYVDSIAASRQQWFDVYSDTETIGRVLAGGDIYNSGAGSDLYSVSDVYEPYSYMVGIPSFYKNDEIDRAVCHNRYYYGMAGSDAYLENLIKGK